MIRVAMDDQVRAAIEAGAIVAYSVSGGKDSSAAMREANAYLDSVGHPRSRRIVVHADLGRAEWQSTAATVERLAEAEGLELMVVRRGAGDLFHRYEQRWKNARARYVNLETYNLIGPWPQADKRFCTAELKQQVIAPALAKRFRGETIISVVGLRRDESTGRRRTPISKVETRYAKPGNRAGTAMVTWFPAVEWTTEEVFACHDRHGIERHEAYTDYGSSRLSCAYCFLASIRDLQAAASAAGNVEGYRFLVALEAASGFSFQGARWLADVAPSLLSPELRALVEQAKAMAAERREIEAAMPAGLRYVKGWPQRMPTEAEAEQIAAARLRILDRLGLERRFVTGADVLSRFAELIAAKEAKEAKASAPPKARKRARHV